MIGIDLQYYLLEIEKCFFVGEEANNGYGKDKPELAAGIIEMENYRSNWDRLIKSIKAIEKVRVRDTSKAAQVNTFSVLVSYPEKVGIILSISFPFKLFGFYYSKFENDTIPGRFRQVNAYVPFDENSKERKSELALLLRTEFVGFKEFNNDFADFKVKRICIDWMVYENLDLWCVFFSTNKHGII